MNKASGGDGIPVEIFQILKDDVIKVLHLICQQKFGKLSSGHRTGKGPFSFQSQRKTMPKNAQTTAQLHSSHTLVGEGNGTPLQYSCLENPVDGGAWKAAVHGVTKSQTRLSDFPFTFTFMHWRRKWQPTPVFSCLENPRDGGAWWAAVYGVTQSRT